MGTKNNPGEFDCYESAAPDEPMFVLLARDPLAPGLVLKWAQQRQALIHNGLKPASDQQKVAEAEACARAMLDWHKANRP